MCNTYCAPGLRGDHPLLEIGASALIFDWVHRRRCRFRGLCHHISAKTPAFEFRFRLPRTRCAGASRSDRHAGRPDLAIRQ